MKDAILFFEKFDITFVEDGETIYITVNPEIVPASGDGLMPSGNYFVYCVHPSYGSCFFIVEQDADCQWICQYRPSFIFDELIEWIGYQIESRNR